MPNLTGNLLFEHLDKFQAYTTNFRHILLQSTRELNPNSFQKINFANKTGILLQFKRLFHDQYYLSVIVIHVQLYLFKFNFLGTRNSLKKKAGRINLTNTWLALLHKQQLKD